MANVEHSDLTGSDLHEPKGADSAAANKFYRSDGAGSGSWVYPNELIGVLQDQKSSGTAGGTFTSGSDQTRDLNTEVYDKYSIIAISSNRFTITPPASSTYIIEWSAPAHSVAAHQSFLYRTSGTPGEVARGTSEESENTVDGNEMFITTRSFGIAVVTISAATTYEIRHRCNTTQTTTGLGTPGSFGTEVYTQVKIHRVG